MRRFFRLTTSGREPRQSYLLRRFTVFYGVFALVPFLLLFYVYAQIGEESDIGGVSRDQLALLIGLVGIASLLGYFAVRSTLCKIVELNEDLRKSLMGKMNKDVILELAQEEGEIAELAKSFGEVFNRLESSLRDLERTKRKLHEVVSRVSRALSSSDRLDLLMQLVLETTVEALDVRQGAIFTLDPEQPPKLEVVVGVEGMSTDEVAEAVRAALQWVVTERRMFVLPVVGEEDRGERAFGPPLVCAPLFIRGKLNGAVCLAGRQGGRNFSEDELKLVSSLGHQIGVAYDNARLSQDAERTYMETISALALAVEARDPCSRGHAERTAQYSVALARQMGLGKHSENTLRDAGRLHDIGKIGIDDSILRKPGSLNDAEWEIVRKHPVLGESIVKPLKKFSHLWDLIRHHHERLDGTGYPDGLRGEQLSLETRILAVANEFDALTSERPYRKPLSYDEALSRLEALAAAGKVDMSIVRALGTVVRTGMARIGSDPIARGDRGTLVDTD